MADLLPLMYLHYLAHVLNSLILWYAPVQPLRKQSTHNTIIADPGSPYVPDCATVEVPTQHTYTEVEGKR